MKKLLFIVLATVLALSVGLVGCGGEGEGEGEAVWNYTIPLQMHCTISDRASITEEVYTPWAAAVNALNGTQGGHFNVTVTYGDAPFDASSSLAAIGTGAVDIGQLSPDTYKLGGLGTLPWFFPNISSCAYTNYYIMTEENGKWDKNGELSSVKILLSTPLWGAQYWGHSVNATVPGNLTGELIRSESSESVMIQSLGAVPVYIATSDLFNALIGHTVEGCFFTYSGIGFTFKLGQACCYTTGLDMFYRPYALAMNKDSYNDLPTEAKTALDTLCGAAQSVYWANQHIAAEAEDKADTEAKGMLYIPTAEEMDLWKAATASVDDWWSGNITSLYGFDGAGILARAAALIAVSP